MTERGAAVYLAFDGGGTATRAALYDADGNQLAEATGGPSNPVEIGVSRCVTTLIQLGRQLLQERDVSLCEIAAGVSGARNRVLRDGIAQGLVQKLGVRRAVVSSDVDALLHANVGADEGMIVIAGTGSSVVAKPVGGEPRIFGGRGTLFGDVGSAYDIAVRALRAAAASLDGLRGPTKLIESLPEAAGLRTFSELIGWSSSATKNDVAALAPVVIALYRDLDDAAYECVAESFNGLLVLAASAARETGLSKSAPVYVHGGVFTAIPEWVAHFKSAMKDGQNEVGLPSEVKRAPFEGTRASVRLLTEPTGSQFVSDIRVGAAGTSADLPRTESMATHEPLLDTLTAEGIVTRMSGDDHEAVEAVADVLPTIGELVQRVADAFTSGGRLIYMGAGTSGRLGVLDASECPPTFGVDPGQVVGIIAGGEVALRMSGEGAEDNEAAAVADLKALIPPLNDRDVVVGIAASGNTPYVLAALDHAKKSGAHTAIICCNPTTSTVADYVVAVDTGPEVLPGSTRLKAGTATKLVLNMISTGAMALSGRVFEGYMVGVRPMNAKLRKRAVRIVSALTGQPESSAAELLETAGDSIAVAVLMARKNVSRDTAEKRLKNAKGNLRAALESD